MWHMSAVWSHFFLVVSRGRQSDVDMCILPWSGWGVCSHVDYEKSTWLTLPKVSQAPDSATGPLVVSCPSLSLDTFCVCAVCVKVEGTIVLFHDGHNLSTPKLLAK
jgi:hypothetical protein